jgi:hypothetical protein
VGDRGWGVWFWSTLIFFLVRWWVGGRVVLSWAWCYDYVGVGGIGVGVGEDGVRVGG